MNSRHSTNIETPPPRTQSPSITFSAKMVTRMTPLSTQEDDPLEVYRHYSDHAFDLPGLLLSEEHKQFEIEEKGDDKDEENVCREGSHDEASTFTFHPVDEPDVEVTVKNIFESSFDPIVVTPAATAITAGSALDEEATATTPHARSSVISRPCQIQQRSVSMNSLSSSASSSSLSSLVSPTFLMFMSPMYVSDHEDDESDSDVGDADIENTKDHPDIAAGYAQKVKGELHLISSNRIRSIRDDHFTGDNDTSWYLFSTLSPSKSPLRENKEEAEAEEEEEEGKEEDDDKYESRKRREEASLDEESRRKKRKIENEERVARANLWKQSLKKSIFRSIP